MPNQNVNPFKEPALFFFPAIIAAIEFIRMALFIIFLPSFLTNLHFATDAIGLVISANILADNLLKSASGWLVDHYGPWPVLSAGSLMVFTGLFLIMNFHSSLLLLLLSSILIGAGASPTWPGSISGALRLAGESKRATIISLISTIWLVGAGAGIAAIGILIDPGFSRRLHLVLEHPYQAGFMLLLAVALLALFICVLGWLAWLRVPHLQVATQGVGAPKPRLIEALRRLWLIKGLLPGMFIQTLALGMLLPNMLPFTISRFGFSEAQYVLLILTGGLAVVAFMVPVGHLADHWGTKGFLAAGFILAAVALLWVVNYADPVNVWWAVGFLGLSYALIQPSWNALLAASIPPSQRGILMGLFMSVEGLGFGLGPLVGGLLGTLTIQHHLHGAVKAALPFYVSSGLLLLMALVYLCYPFRHYNIEDN